MYYTPPTSGAAGRSTSPGASASPSIVQDAAKTFIRRPETKRRSLDNMNLYNKQQNTYAEKSSDQLLQEVMRTFEDIPVKVQQYPQMRRDIKVFLEEQSDKCMRILFELSKRTKSLEAEASGAGATTVAVPPKPTASNSEIPGQIESLKESLQNWLSESHHVLRRVIQSVGEKVDSQTTNIIDKISEKMEVTQVEIDQSTEGMVVRAQTQVEDLVATVARDVVMETKTHLDEMLKGRVLGSDPDPIPRTYACAVATGPGRRPALHSLAVTSSDSQETADEVLARVKKAVDARTTGLKVSKARKAKGSTVILGCDTEVERDRVTVQIKSCGDGLVVAPMKNKDPLVVLKDVFLDGEDDEMLKALYTQNPEVFMGLPQEEKDLTVKYKKRTRNPKSSHVVLQVKPRVWQRMTETGTLYLDLQRVRVEDQSPLIQCTKCLAFGHGRKFCTESVDRCSHCGGSHLRDKCADYSARKEPQCCNCSHSGLQNTGHNAFSAECPTRQKWDYLARSNTAYL